MRRGNPQRKKAMYAWAMKKGRTHDPDTAHKHPDEYKDWWDKRVSRTHKGRHEHWTHKLGQRAEFYSWPYTGWDRDPIRHFKNDDVTCSRTVNAAVASLAVVGAPHYDYYAATSQRYNLDGDAPLTSLLPILNTYVGKIWSANDLSQYLARIEKVFPGIQKAHDSWDALEQWNSRQHAIPVGLQQHLKLLLADISRQNVIYQNRLKKQRQGELRARNGEQYYMLPYPAATDMPKQLEQEGGEQPRGKNSWGLVPGRTHATYLPDFRRKKNFRPA